VESQNNNVFIRAVEAINEAQRGRHESILRELDRLSSTTDRAIERLTQTITAQTDTLEKRMDSHEREDNARFNSHARLIYMGVGGLGLLAILIPILMRMVFGK